MNEHAGLHIDPPEQFPHLSHAPITEAVIEIRAHAMETVTWNESEILAKLKSQLPDYPEHRPTRGFESQFQIRPGQEPSVATRDLGLQGFQFASTDKKRITNFQRVRFSFSWLHPYPNWKDFSGEALRLWKIHQGLAQPLEIQRLGVRFINRITVPAGRISVENYFKGFPEELGDLGLIFENFLHRNVLLVPGHPYAMNIIKTVQPASAPGIAEPALILDIDVYTREAFKTSDEEIKRRLAEMRWLKNKAFFGIITGELKESLV